MTDKQNTAQDLNKQQQEQQQELQVQEQQQELQPEQIKTEQQQVKQQPVQEVTEVQEDAGQVLTTQQNQSQNIAGQQTDKKQDLNTIIQSQTQNQQEEQDDKQQQDIQVGKQQNNIFLQQSQEQQNQSKKPDQQNTKSITEEEMRKAQENLGAFLKQQEDPSQGKKGQKPQEQQEHSEDQVKDKDQRKVNQQPDQTTQDTKKSIKDQSSKVEDKSEDDKTNKQAILDFVEKIKELNKQIETIKEDENYKLESRRWRAINYLREQKSQDNDANLQKYSEDDIDKANSEDLGKIIEDIKESEKQKIVQTLLESHKKGSVDEGITEDDLDQLKNRIKKGKLTEGDIENLDATKSKELVDYAKNCQALAGMDLLLTQKKALLFKMKKDYNNEVKEHLEKLYSLEQELKTETKKQEYNNINSKINSQRIDELVLDAKYKEIHNLQSNTKSLLDKLGKADTSAKQLYLEKINKTKVDEIDKSLESKMNNSKERSDEDQKKLKEIKKQIREATEEKIEFGTFATEDGYHNKDDSYVKDYMDLVTYQKQLENVIAQYMLQEYSLYTLNYNTVYERYNKTDYENVKKLIEEEKKLIDELDYTNNDYSSNLQELQKKQNEVNKLIEDQEKHNNFLQYYDKLDLLKEQIDRSLNGNKITLKQYNKYKEQLENTKNDNYDDDTAVHIVYGKEYNVGKLKNEISDALDDMLGKIQILVVKDETQNQDSTDSVIHNSVIHMDITENKNNEQHDQQDIEQLIQEQVVQQITGNDTDNQNLNDKDKKKQIETDPQQKLNDTQQQINQQQVQKGTINQNTNQDQKQQLQNDPQKQEQQPQQPNQQEVKQQVQLEQKQKTRQQNDQDQEIYLKTIERLTEQEEKKTTTTN